MTHIGIFLSKTFVHIAESFLSTNQVLDSTHLGLSEAPKTLRLSNNLPCLWPKNQKAFRFRLWVSFQKCEFFKSFRNCWNSFLETLNCCCVAHIWRSWRKNHVRVKHFCGPWLQVLGIRLSWSIVASTSSLISQIQLGQGYIQNVSKCQVQNMKFRNAGKITHNDTCTYKLAETTIWSDLLKKVEAICDISVLVEHLKCTPTKNLFESWVIGCCSIYPPGTFAPRDGCELSQLGSSDPKACRPRESKPGRLRTFTGTWWNMVKRTENETQIILWYEEVHKDQDLETYLRPWKKKHGFHRSRAWGPRVYIFHHISRSIPVEGLHTVPFLWK